MPKLRTLSLEFAPEVVSHTTDQKDNFYDDCMKAECNKNGRLIFKVFVGAACVPKLRTLRAEAGAPPGYAKSATPFSCL